MPLVTPPEFATKSNDFVGMGGTSLLMTVAGGAADVVLAATVAVMAGLDPIGAKLEAIAGLSATLADPLPLAGRGTGWGSIRMMRALRRRASASSRSAEIYAHDPHPLSLPARGREDASVA